MPRAREKLAPHHRLASSQAEPAEAVARVARARRTRAVRTHRASTNTGHAVPREGGQTRRRKPENQALEQGHHGCTRLALENHQTLRSAISGNGHTRQVGRIRMSHSARDGCPSRRDSTDGMTCPVRVPPLAWVVRLVWTTRWVPFQVTRLARASTVSASASLAPLPSGRFPREGRELPPRQAPHSGCSCHWAASAAGQRRSWLAYADYGRAYRARGTSAARLATHSASAGASHPTRQPSAAARRVQARCGSDKLALKPGRVPAVSEAKPARVRQRFRITELGGTAWRGVVTSRGGLGRLPCPFPNPNHKERPYARRNP